MISNQIKANEKKSWKRVHLTTSSLRRMMKYHFLMGNEVMMMLMLRMNRVTWVSPKRNANLKIKKRKKNQALPTMHPCLMNKKCLLLQMGSQRKRYRQKSVQTRSMKSRKQIVQAVQWMMKQEAIPQMKMNLKRLLHLPMQIFLTMRLLACGSVG
nr:hypothetical protein Iba_chr10bCG10040 [Ipomoea batatas]GMD47222.1 hypothetical protein Iba_chr10eCG10830 [Ipomoea batatas]